MNAMLKLSLAGALAAAMLFTNAYAQQSALKKQIVGTWTLVSFETVEPGGAKRPGVEGTDPKGLLIMGSDGRFSQQVIAVFPKFAVDRLKTTPQEDYAMARGVISYFGTYTVNDKDKSLIFHIERSSYPNQNGMDQKRSITSLNANEMTLTLTRMAGGQNTLVWRRAK
jgi:hypothetical protein